MRVVLNTLNLRSENLGGGWVYTWQLARALQRYSDELELIILAHESTAPAFRSLSHTVHTVSMDATNRMRRVLWEQFSLPKEIERYAPEVVHGPGNVLPGRTSARSVVTIHDFQWYYYPENFSFARRIYLQHMVKSSARSADRVICVSQATKRDLLTFCRVNEDRVSVIHEAGLTQDESMPRRDLDVGSSLPHKNLARLIDAFGMVASRIPHDLLIVGESFGFHSALTGAVDRVNREHGQRIRFTGYVRREDLVGLYHCSDAFVFPSLFEGFGIPAVEAMGCGVPVIASSATSLPEVIGDAGAFFDPMNTEDLAAQLARVCLDRNYHRTLSDAGRTRARSFSWDAMAQQTLEVYRAAAQG
jgi:glycosyltransferase involved in cell wall biosynthesis